MADKNKKITVFILIGVIFLLLGVVGFITLYVQQNQSPDDSGAAVQACDPSTFIAACQPGNTGYKCNCVGVATSTCSTAQLVGGKCYVVNCGQPDSSCIGSTTSQCPLGQYYSGECNQNGCSGGKRMAYQCNNGSVSERGCQVDPACPTSSGNNTGTDTGSTPDPNTTCVITYRSSTTVDFSKGCAGKELQYFHSSYDGATNKCPTSENPETRFTVGTEGGSYSSNAQPGECRQLDHHFAGVNSSGTAVGSGGVCGCNAPVVSPPPPSAPTTITCYKCTTPTTDGNMCESFTTTESACPAGSSATSACETAVGGACPVENTPTTTCYRCTVPTNDANMCESFSVSGTVCPSGSTTEALGCAAVAPGAACPIDAVITPPTLPQTAVISDNFDRLILGFMMILLGVLVYKYDIFSKFGTYFYVAKNIDIQDIEKEAKVKNHIKKATKLKKDRGSFEDKVSKKFESN